MFLALKITQAVLKYNDIHWTIAWKDNSVQGGYSSSSCTQRLAGKCRRFSVLDMCTIQSLFKKNDVTQGRFHLHIKICSFMSAEPARQKKKKSIQKAHIKIPFLVFLDTYCLLNSIDHGKFKSARISIIFTLFFSSFPSSSRPWHSLTHCISKYYKLSHKRSVNQFPYGLSVLHVFPHLLSFNSFYLLFSSVYTSSFHSFAFHTAFSGSGANAWGIRQFYTHLNHFDACSLLFHNELPNLNHIFLPADHVEIKTGSWILALQVERSRSSFSIRGLNCCTAFQINVSFPVLETINSETALCKISSALLSIVIQPVHNLQWHVVLIWHFKEVCMLTKLLVHILLSISKHCYEMKYILATRIFSKSVS